ncbi:hypothetical protein [Zavarzinia sp.]|uniref:hypothetical protein n=1 Tax=Zavarzinia sp. TaxID=2027920 RepID=UPI003BB57BD6
MTELFSGLVIDYPYLWRWQDDRGETEGRKERPSCLAFVVKGKSDGLTHVALLAISSTAPREGQVTVEVPEAERRRAGLDPAKRAWITVSEWNHDIAERSFYLGRNARRFGRFGDSFLREVLIAFRPFLGREIDRR